MRVSGRRNERLVDIVGVPAQRIWDMRKGVGDDAFSDCVWTGGQIRIIWHVNPAGRIDRVVVLDDGTTVGTSTASDWRRIRKRLPGNVSAAARLISWIEADGLIVSPLLLGCAASDSRSRVRNTSPGGREDVQEEEVTEE